MLCLVDLIKVLGGAEYRIAKVLAKKIGRDRSKDKIVVGGFL
jgi:hypothetical protein